jgi:hypothetical protein
MAEYFGLSAVSKIILLVVSPVGTVLFSYLAKSSKVFDKKLAIKMNIIGIVLSIILTIPFIYVGKFVCWILYPEYLKYENSNFLIMAITFGVMLSTMWTIINLYYLKHLSMNYQRNNQLFICVFSVILSIFFSKKWGIEGYAISILLINLLKFLIQIVVLFTPKIILENEKRAE